jgi:hypothetical protein
MKHQRGFTIVKLTIAVLFLLGAGGWIANIVKLIGMDFGSITGMLIARAAGIFVAPLGAVLGFL